MTDFREIQLTQGKVAIVDAADFEWLNQWKWSAHFHKKRNCFYAVRGVGGRKHARLLRMHRVIMGEPEGMDVDHRDLDGLNNRRSNLRVCTRQQNNFNSGAHRNNTSGYKGVTWDKVRRKWAAQTRLNGKTIHLGRFDAITDAATAYREAAAKYHGEFARTEKTI